MEADADLTGMDAGRLAEALARAEEELEDVFYEREFVLGQTGMHIGANELARNQKSWAKDEARLRDRIAAIQERLAG